jgi:hypothetical protein
MKGRLHFFLAFVFIASFVFSACAPAATPAPTATPAPPTDTPLPTQTYTPEPTYTNTPRPTSTPWPTATPNLEATAQYENISAKIQDYFSKNYISSADSMLYKHQKDFSDEWAQIGWYQWTYIKESPDNFVIETDVAWQSASSAADSSGCGFVFRVKDKDNYYVMYVSLKGYVIPYAVVGGSHRRLGAAYYGSPAQNGAVHLTLIMEDSVFRVLINDKFIKAYTGLDGKLMTGKIGYTVFSGTNKDFGTRCHFTNTDLWGIKK